MTCIIVVETWHYFLQHQKRQFCYRHRSHVHGNVSWQMIGDTSFIRHSDPFIFPCLLCYSSIGASTEQLSGRLVPLIKDSRLPRVSSFYSRYILFSALPLSYLISLLPHLEYCSLFYLPLSVFALYSISSPGRSIMKAIFGFGKCLILFTAITKYRLEM